MADLINCLVLLGPVGGGDRLYYTDETIQLAASDANALAASGTVRILTEAKPPLNINSATAEELAELKHVSPAIAKKLVEARPFASLNDAWVASGIAGAKWKEIESLLEV